MPIEPYLFYNGRCDEAIAFYGAVLGAETTYLARYRDAPEGGTDARLPPGFENKVMHANLRIGDATIMVSDGNVDTGPNFQGFALTHNLPDEATMRATFAVLAEGGSVIMPPMRTFWSPCFGMLNDRFGVCWMLMVAEAPPA
jgi:PhnB protein